MAREKSVKLHPFRSGSQSGGHNARAVRLRRPTLYVMRLPRSSETWS